MPGTRAKRREVCSAMYFCKRLYSVFDSGQSTGENILGGDTLHG